MNDLLKFSVPKKPEYVSVVRLSISSIANNMGFDIEDIEDIKVAVSEACTNALCHGKCENEDIKYDNYDVICLKDGNKLNIIIEDFGCGCNMEKYNEPDKEDPKDNGFGLYIIKALMDEVYIDSKEGFGTKIQMIKYLV